MKETLNLAEIKNDNIVISYDSENNPYSYYHHDKWFFWSLGFDISFSRLSGDFKSVVKSIIYKISYLL